MQTKVTTYSTAAGRTINLTSSQTNALEAAGEWPRTAKGDEYCQVSHSLHEGAPAADNSTDVAAILAAAR